MIQLNSPYCTAPTMSTTSESRRRRRRRITHCPRNRQASEPRRLVFESYRSTYNQHQMSSLSHLSPKHELQVESSARSRFVSNQLCTICAEVERTCIRPRSSGPSDSGFPRTTHYSSYNVLQSSV
jgi:hypothetical protein